MTLVDDLLIIDEFPCSVNKDKPTQEYREFDEHDLYVPTTVATLIFSNLGPPINLLLPITKNARLT
jgi:hypothetical protein